MPKITIVDPKTGKQGDIEPDDIWRAIHDGYQITQPVAIYDPQDKRVGEVDPEHLTKALQDGLIPVGSHAHKVATTSTLEAAGRGAAQGATFGFADELQALAQAPFSDRTYEQLRDEYRKGDELAQEAHPAASIAGNLAGGVGSAILLPGGGLGALGKIAKTTSTLGKLGQTAKVGAAVGGLSGLGSSTAELSNDTDVAGAAKDIAKGAGLGAAFGTGIQALGSIASKGAQIAGKATRDVLDPVLQRAQVLGMKVSDLTGPNKIRATAALKAAAQDGLFGKTADGAAPSAETMQAHVNTRLPEIASEIQSTITSAAEKAPKIPTDVISQAVQEGLADVNPREYWGKHIGQGAAEALKKDPSNWQFSLLKDFSEIVNRAAPTEEVGIVRDGARALERVAETGGDLKSLWELKKATGTWATWGKKVQDLPATAEAYGKLNQTLNEVLLNATDKVAAEGAPKLADLNKLYASYAFIQPRLEKQSLAQQLNSTLKLGDFAKGGIVGALTGSPLIGTGVTMASAAVRSTEGRLARAKLGEFLHIGQQNTAVQQGAIPRTTTGFKTWVAANMVPLKQQFPQMVGQIEQLVTAPPERSATLIRSIMPMIQGMMAPSPFPSELDGKVSSAEDRLTASQILQSRSTSLSPTELADRQSALNKTGELPSEVFTPEETHDHVKHLHQKLREMGY